MVEQIVALLHVFALGCRRLGLDHRLNQAGGVFHQFGGTKLTLPTGA